MANCKYLKIKLNRQLECKKSNKLISFKDCKSCPFKEYKQSSSSSLQNSAKTPQKMKKRSNNSQIRNAADNNDNKSKNTRKMKKKSNKLVKLEKKRFSLFTSDAKKCYFCSSSYHLTWHEIFRGKNRPNSIKYGLCLRMCLNCHEKYQDDKEFNDFWHKKGQAMFEKTYPDLKFEDIFKRNYK